MPGTSRTLKYITWTAAAVLVFLLIAAADLGLRSRGALERAGQHAYWRDNPEKKAAHFEKAYALRIEAIRAEAAAGRTTAEEAARKEALAAAERDFRISEGSAKQAYIWYRTAAEDFPSPLNPWAKKAEKELPAALDAWRTELRGKGIQPQEWMLQ